MTVASFNPFYNLIVKIFFKIIVCGIINSLDSWDEILSEELFGCDENITMT